MTMCWPLNSAEDRAHNIVSTPNAMFASENSGQPSLSSVPVARSNRVPGTEISSDSAGSLESANELDVPPERLFRNLAAAATRFTSREQGRDPPRLRPVAGNGPQPPRGRHFRKTV